MIWPGMGDPYKRKKTIQFLVLSAGIGAAAVLLTVFITNPLIAKQPHNSCIDDLDTNWEISFYVEVIVDGIKLENKPDIGITEGCQRAI